MRHISLILLQLTLLALPVSAQVVLDSSDVPLTAGLLFLFYLETDPDPTDTLGIPVTISQPGPDQQWDFTSGGTDMLEIDSLFDPQQSALSDSFPEANRGVASPALFGVDLFGTDIHRFERVTGEGWFLDGLGLTLFTFPPIGFPFDPPLQIAQFPLEIGQEWAISDTFETIYEDSATGGEFLIRFEYGGFNMVDASGSALFEGGQEPCLRIHSTFGGELNVYPIIFGVPLPFPVFSQDFPLTQVYNFIAPEVGEIASISSLPGEEEALFEQASRVRRRTLNPSHLEPTRAPLPGTMEITSLHPNPFNNTLMIQVDLTQPLTSGIHVHDILGREVARLAASGLPVGRHNLVWQPREAASGVYFLRIEDERGSRVRKAVLLR